MSHVIRHTRPWPVFRAAHQPGLHRMEMNGLHLSDTTRRRRRDRAGIIDPVPTGASVISDASLPADEGTPRSAGKRAPRRYPNFNLGGTRLQEQTETHTEHRLVAGGPAGRLRFGSTLCSSAETAVPRASLPVLQHGQDGHGPRRMAVRRGAPWASCPGAYWGEAPQCGVSPFCLVVAALPTNDFLPFGRAARR